MVVPILQLPVYKSSKAHVCKVFAHVQGAPTNARSSQFTSVSGSAIHAHLHCACGVIPSSKVNGKPSCERDLCAYWNAFRLSFKLSSEGDA